MRIRVFAKFIAEYGESELIENLERNEKAGIVYHYVRKLNTEEVKNYLEEKKQFMK